MELTERLLHKTSVDHRAEGKSLWRDLPAIRLRLPGPDHLKTKQAQLLWAGVTSGEGAARLAAEILEMVHAEKGPRHPDTIEALFELAVYTPYVRSG